ncbi:MAG: hypothetical protein IPF99_10280 [Deltaproteobacteria bacterium]|nr:hypothetical protein [Deltaproteobacteria bacterium]MBP6832096.1 hypothetical protein [Deltaproteobacteria bacterium]
MATDPDAVDGPKKKPARSIGALVALGAVAVTIPLLLYAARNGPDHEDRLHDPLELSDEAELRAVVQAISGVIQAHPGDEEDRALRALEGLHPRSPGASDLRESCVTTYRGAHDAQQISAELRALLPSDGGTLGEEQVRRMNEMFDRSRRLLNEARDAHLRCVGLYEQAATRLHITPARRPNS